MTDPQVQHDEPNTFADKLTDADAVFIADLHLSENEPQLVSAFHDLVNQLTQNPPDSLYILGDWFDSWIGDDYVADDEAQWIRELCRSLQTLALKGTHIYFCQGNRDFTLGNAFLARFSGTLLHDITHIDYGGVSYRIEHGDRLCTDDKKYQWFRRIIRFPLVKWFLLNKSLRKRKTIAANLRQKSRVTNQLKSAAIMDVNLNAVLKALKKHDVLIHGHTHRPNTHKLPSGKMRYVLGDWRVINSSCVEAVIGVLNANGFELVTYAHHTTAN